jgi:hypothetical protein
MVGSKMVLFMNILKDCKHIGDKLVLFAQSHTVLNLIEEFLVAESSNNESANPSSSADNTEASFY